MWASSFRAVDRARHPEIRPSTDRPPRPVLFGTEGVTWSILRAPLAAPIRAGRAMVEKRVFVLRKSKFDDCEFTHENTREKNHRTRRLERTRRRIGVVFARAGKYPGRVLRGVRAVRGSSAAARRRPRRRPPAMADGTDDLSQLFKDDLLGMDCLLYTSDAAETPYV